MEKEEKERIIKDLTESIYPDDIVAAILSHFEKFTADKAIIHEAFYTLKKEYPDYFEDFIFSNRNYHYSSLLDRVIFRLMTSGLLCTYAPSYKYYFIEDKCIKQMKKFVSKFDKAKIKEMADHINFISYPPQVNTQSRQS